MGGTSGVIILMVSDMKKEDFLNTKWDARGWSENMKRKWQERMFEIGFFWSGGSRLIQDDGDFYYYVYENQAVTHNSKAGYFEGHPHEEMLYSEAFPETLTEQGQKHDGDKPRSQPRNKYDREILPSVYVDVYDVLRAFKTHSPALDHAAKKLLASGERGHKDRLTDLKECIASIQAEIDSMGEWL